MLTKEKEAVLPAKALNLLSQADHAWQRPMLWLLGELADALVAREEDSCKHAMLVFDLEEMTEARQRDRKRLRRVLGMAKHTRLSAAWKAAAKNYRSGFREMCAGTDSLIAERDELRHLFDSRDGYIELLAERGSLRIERDELRRQLKEVTDCIVHYAPTDFPILKYSSTVEALGALFEETNELETTV